jgi:hypothetical protein
MDIVALFSQLIFPVAVAAYLLWERTQTMEKMRNNIIENKIGIYLILEKIDSLPEFTKRLQEFRVSGAMK